jgi:hypothetical protein
LGSKSKPTRRKPSLKRTRALKRHNIDFSPAAYWSQQGELFLTPEVIPYAWAACRRGAFDGKAGFASSLDPTEFDRVWRERINQFINSGGEVVVPMAKVRGELIPVGMISIAYQENRAYPHAIWFPEASARIRLEIGVKFIVELKKTHLVLITAEMPDIHYFRHLSRYGLLKAVGKIQGYTATGDDVMMFQSAGT